MNVYKCAFNEQKTLGLLFLLVIYIKTQQKLNLKKENMQKITHNDAIVSRSTKCAILLNISLV